MYEDTHLFSIYDRVTTESIVPIAAFVAKKIIALKKSFSTSNDTDEMHEIHMMLLFHQSALLLLCLSFFAEENELTDLAKEIYKN